jgi:maleate cis-trans isomerase
MRRMRIAVLFPSTGLIDGELCDMAEERGASALIYKVAPQAIAPAEDPQAVAAMVTDMGAPATLAAVARTAAAVSPDVVVWACTSGSFLGAGRRGLEQATAMSEALGGVPATTTSLAITWTSAHALFAALPWSRPIIRTSARASSSTCAIRGLNPARRRMPDVAATRRSVH